MMCEGFLLQVHLILRAPMSSIRLLLFIPNQGVPFPTVTGQKMGVQLDRVTSQTFLYIHLK